MSSARSQDAFRRYSWGVVVANLGVILWGAFVRASGSGAGCGSHWPDCNGDIVHRPESVETMIELTHRLTSGVALLLVVAQLVWALRIFARPHPARRAAIASMIFMLTEAAVGAGIVLLELVGENASAARAGWIALHLVNTFLLVAALVLTAHHAHPVVRSADSGGGVGWLVGSSLVALLVTGVAGAITALGDTLFPVGTPFSGSTLAEGASSTAHFLVRLRVVHPVIATATFVWLAMASALLATLRPDPRVRRAGVALVAVMTLQMIVGLVNVALLAPIPLQLVHLLLADLAWIALVLLGASALAAPRASVPVREEDPTHVAPTP